MRQPIGALEASLRKLRVLGIAVLFGVTLSQRGTQELTVAEAMLVLGASVLLLAANFGSEQLQRCSADRAEQIVLGGLVIDTVVVAGALLWFDPGPNTLAWIVIGLPVLEGAMRYGLLGAIGSWLAISAAMITSTLYQWSPAEGLEPIAAMVGMLPLGLGLGIPAGHIADRLTDELLYVREQRREATRLSRLLAVLAVAADDLTTVDKKSIARTAVEATTELGYQAADIGVLDSTDGTWTTLDEAFGPDSVLPLPDPNTDQLMELAAGESRLVVDGRLTTNLVLADQHIAVILRGRFDDSPPFPARLEAFSMLCTKVGTALTLAARHATLEETRRQLRHDATHDKLTGVLNRAGLLAAVNDADAESAAGSSGRTITMIDLDGFKEINDTHGHDAGDLVLVEVAKRLTRLAPPGSVVARLGGDEFVIILESECVADLLPRLQRLVARPIATVSGELSVGASIGTNTLDDSCGFAEALRQADQKMYANKQARRPPVPSAV